MKLYRRSQRDKVGCINRCHFDADHGRVELALTRLSNLNDEFPDDAQIAYAEGLIRKDYLGQGLKSYALFSKAYELDSHHAFGACNAAKFAPTEKEFRKWTKIALGLLPPNDSSRDAMGKFLSDVDKGLAHRELLLYGSNAHFEERMYGDSAALMELALQASGLGLQDEITARRMRAQCLRSLDSQAHTYRQTLMEAFLPEERLALVEALAEIDKAISLDEYDAELWNLKAAWLTLLERYEEAVECADRAIQQRPSAYAKPYHNKANALSGMKRDADALECAQQSVSHAEESGDPADIALSRKLVAAYSVPREEPTLSGAENIVRHILNAANITSDQELGQWKGSPKKLVAGVVRRLKGLRSNHTADYVPLMAELLSDFTPETVFVVILKVAEHSQALHDHCLHAALYVTAYSDGVQQRDAARFLSFVLLGAMDAAHIRSSYRQAVLEPSAAATDEMAQLDDIMRQQLQRMLPTFPKLIADQPPVDDMGHRRAEANILARLSGFQPGSSSQASRGLGEVLRRFLRF